MSLVLRPGQRRQSIAAKLGLSFSLLVVILGAAAHFGMASLNELHVALHDVERAAARQGAVLRLASAVRDQYAHMAHTLIVSDGTRSQYFADASALVKTTTARVEGGADGEERSLTASFAPRTNVSTGSSRPNSCQGSGVGIGRPPLRYTKESSTP